MKTLMLSILFVFTLNCGEEANAQNIANGNGNMQTGYYEVPRPDGKIVNFPGQIEFSGDTLQESDEFIVHFPEQLTGVANKFTIKKGTDGQWHGDPNLFNEMSCEPSGIYDLSCAFEFKPSAVVTVSPSFLTNPLENLVMVNHSLAKSNMVAAGLSLQEIETNLISTDIFSSEPIGFLKYRAVVY